MNFEKYLGAMVQIKLGVVMCYLESQPPGGLRQEEHKRNDNQSTNYKAKASLIQRNSDREQCLHMCSVTLTHPLCSTCCDK